MRAIVLADTHIRSTVAPGRSPRRLPDEVCVALEAADVILHAGDVLDREVLDELASFAPVHAVLGNNDHTLVGELPESLELDLDGVPVAMIHDTGLTSGRAARMHRRFPAAAIVVYGHSHTPDDSLGEAGQRLFNPGSAIERRRAPMRTYGELDLADGRILHHRIVPLPDR